MFGRGGLQETIARLQMGVGCTVSRTCRAQKPGHAKAQRVTVKLFVGLNIQDWRYGSPGSMTARNMVKVVLSIGVLVQMRGDCVVRGACEAQRPGHAEAHKPR